MRSTGILLLITLALVSAQEWWGVNNVGCILGNVPTKDENAPKHLQWARFLLDKVVSGEGTSYYDHVAGPIYWGPYSCNANNYTSVSDCNGLASAILLQAYNMTIDSPPGFNHAYASTYWHAFVDEAFGFQRIHEVADIQEGDFIAYNYLYGKNDTEYLSTQNSGHLVVVTSVPTIAPSSAPIIPDTIQWAVEIIDQTSDFHYMNDTRFNKSTGLGSGLMRLYTSASNGSFVGYAWSFSPITKFYFNDVIRSPAVGRLTTYPITGCGVSITQSLLKSWKAGNDAIPHTQWNVTVSTSSKQVNSLQFLISYPSDASFSSWQIQPVPGQSKTFTSMDWHFNNQWPLPTNYQFNFGYTVSSSVQAPVYVLSSSC